MKNYILVILALSILLLSGCITSQIGGMQSPCSEYIEIMAEARNTNNPSLCNSIDDESCVKGCIYEVAYLNQEEAHCSLIKDEITKSHCYANLAPAKGAHLCESITVESEAEAPGFNYLCLGLRTTLPKVISEGKYLCVTPNWRDRCISNVANQRTDASVCDLISDPKMKDICVLESDRSNFYFGNSKLNCLLSLSLSKSQEFCKSAKTQNAGFVGFLTSENLEKSCGNKLCEPVEGALGCPQDCRVGSGGCVVAGHFTTTAENFPAQESVGCCEGLVEAEYGEYKGRGTVCKKVSKGDPRTCIKPNDGVCGPGENKCNSPEDCGE